MFHLIFICFSCVTSQFPEGSWDINSNDADPMPRADEAGLNHHGTRLVQLCFGEEKKVCGFTVIRAVKTEVVSVSLDVQERSLQFPTRIALWVWRMELKSRVRVFVCLNVCVCVCVCVFVCASNNVV